MIKRFVTIGCKKKISNPGYRKGFTNKKIKTSPSAIFQLLLIKQWYCFESSIIACSLYPISCFGVSNHNWISIRFDPPNASFALLLTEGPNYEPLMRITLKGSSDTLICPVVTKMALVRPNYLKITFKVSGMAWGKLWVARRATLIEP